MGENQDEERKDKPKGHRRITFIRINMKEVTYKFIVIPAKKI